MFSIFKKKNPIILALLGVVVIISCIFIFFSAGKKSINVQSDLAKISEPIKKNPEELMSPKVDNRDLSPRVHPEGEENFMVDLNNPDEDNKDLVELYQKIDKLYEKYDKPKDRRVFLVEQAKLLIDYQLGPNHPAREAYGELMGWSNDQREPLNNKFQSGEINRREFFKQLDDHLKDLSQRCSDLFTNDEYYAMFKLSKGESFAEALSIMPENADWLDEDIKSSPPLSGELGKVITKKEKRED
jgi:hypothetical protein